MDQLKEKRFTSTHDAFRLDSEDGQVIGLATSMDLTK